VYVRAGSILPLGPVKQHVAEKTEIPIIFSVYAGADCVFDFYDDAGDGYGYENGEYAWLHLRWEDARGVLMHTSEGKEEYLPIGWSVKVIR
jgi:alpha-glucosidase (family GH31 glycosyl hydrolase)